LIIYTEVKNIIGRVAQLKQAMGETSWRVTPRSADPAIGFPKLSPQAGVNEVGSSSTDLRLAPAFSQPLAPAVDATGSADVEHFRTA
jgi:hypothetical protein